MVKLVKTLPRDAWESPCRTEEVTLYLLFGDVGIYRDRLILEALLKFIDARYIQAGCSVWAPNIETQEAKASLFVDVYE